MRIGIVGSRGYQNSQAIKDFIMNLPNDTVIISGGARGADSLAEYWAYVKQLKTLIIKPNWRANGKKAGFLRNTTIVENSDEIVAFWDGRSRGTLDTINKARSVGKKVTIIGLNPVSK